MLHFLFDGRSVAFFAIRTLKTEYRAVHKTVHLNRLESLDAHIKKRGAAMTEKEIIEKINSEKKTVGLHIVGYRIRKKRG